MVVALTVERAIDHSCSYLYRPIQGRTGHTAIFANGKRVKYILKTMTKCLKKKL